ncbi:MAG: ATP-binding protein [Spirochaetia bacterium]|nr:ATP-binding protein [Spirochaetia bacterium]
MEGRSISLFLHPHWDEIERARRACAAFLEALDVSESARDSLSMITAELLENAVKYGDFSPEDNVIPFRIRATADSVIVEAWSPLRSVGISAKLKRLDSFIQWIRSFQSPFQAYLERIKLVAGQPMEDNESGLGLVRIAYEGEAILDFYINEHDCLYISALRPLARKDQVKSYAN